ncbi:hypothetical protein B0J12DRAFT_702791 [Macrophomina phaseolina]|uniref:Uncharacterized protein n=1 Tax=Macrophomina phaseolina TaxID=35725 RepID=A0ABQ8G3F2_9PEZI|nr:hypothetical protein B0J12DRAFT_702791 [Macrophomina phaseolina]
MELDTSGLLSCTGVLQTSDDPEAPSEHQLVFNIPSALTSIRTLRAALSQPSATVSLANEISLATAVARNDIFLHSLHFVNKNIRSETVLLFRTHLHRLARRGRR